MKIPIRHKPLSYILIILGIIFIIFSWFIYLNFINSQDVYIKNKTLEIFKFLKEIQRIENIYIAKAFFSNIKDIIDSEDKNLIEKKIDEITGLTFYEGAVFIKNAKVIYKSKGAPNINYTSLTEFSKKWPHSVYTIKTNKDFWGISIFSLCKEKSMECRPYAICVLYFNWKHLIDTIPIPFGDLLISLGEKNNKRVIRSIPLNRLNGLTQAYLNFTLSGSTLYFRYLLIIFIVISNIIVGVFIFPWILYLAKEREYIKNTTQVLGESSENVTLEEVLDLTVKNLYTHKLYKKTLEATIATKSVKEALRVLASTLSEMVDSKYWGIMLLSLDFKEWRLFLWSIGFDVKCFDKALNVIKKQNSIELKKIINLKEVYLLNDINEIDFLKNIECISYYHVKSISAIPMIVNDEVIGLLLLAWDQKKEFGSYDKLVFENVRDMIRDILKSTYNIHDMFWISYKDPLLDIYNRRILKDIANKDYEGTLLYLDLDNFKSVNDKYGHDMGDRLLKKFVSTVKGLLRSEDIILRYGGDEFIIYLRNTDIETAEKIAQRIREKIKEEFLDYGVTVSIGVVELEENATIYEKISEADKKMYEEKRRKHMNL